MVGPICSVCSHCARAEIDRQLTLGVPVRTVASTFNITKSVVSRHKNLHCGLVGSPGRPPIPDKPEKPKGPTREEALAKANARRAELAELSRGTVAQTLLPTAQELSEKYQGYMDRLEAVISRAEEEGAAALSIQGLTAARQTVDSLAKLCGLTGGGNQTNVQVNVAIDASQIVSGLLQHLNGSMLPPEVIDLAVVEDAPDV